ncbi:low temperature requirement protein A [Kutzneria sp. NPDC051319]|uniref:low temperature requirement protein A n=1 Tax=Kutzneria sp. NPDC051319 TaxID=3155047 RepID=UPI0034305352
MADAAEDRLKVSSLELFFDLVFVFTITQLTSVLSHHLDPVGLAQMALQLGVIWWMYGGYAWLTNAVPPRKATTRGLLVLAMVAYLVLAISVPSAFEADRWVFAGAYLVIVLVHSGVFLTTTHPGNRRGILRVLPWNLTVPLLLFVAAAVPDGPWRWACWALVAVLLWIGALVRLPDDIEVRPSHFVERHGLVLIIAFGESVVAVGIGAADIEVTPGLIVAAALTMVMLAGLWWCYFAGDNEERAEAVLSGAANHKRVLMSLLGYGHCFLLLLGGIIVLAAGVKKAVAHPWDALPAPAALALGGGVALYLVGDVLLRLVLHLGSNWTRCVAAVLAAASTVVGATGSAVAQLAVLTAVVLLLVAAEHLGRQPGGLPSSG